MNHTLISNELSVVINSHGAEISSVKNKNGTEFIWQAKAGVWARHAPVLFPIVGKLKNNQFIFEGKRYELPQHGFARDVKFELKEKTETTCVFELHSTAETKKIFPFEFIFSIVYKLSGNKISVAYTVKNPANENLFFSVGAHPAFNVPLQANETFEDYYLEFEKNSLEITTLNNGLRTSSKHTLALNDKKLFLATPLFNNDALVFENSQLNSVALCSSTSAHKLILKSKGFPYYGIWSKKDCREFICLEPWFGVTDHENSNQQFTEKDGIISLKANEEFVCGYEMSFF
ncbi:MAG: aldose 1-epimerase family protein [Bacteroidetes bacterium]|nr:aldose 1-epimerase family protein [Bacteroidota bacterium]